MSATTSVSSSASSAGRTLPLTEGSMLQRLLRTAVTPGGAVFILAAILFVVAWNMGEWKEIPGILRLDAADIAVWLITFALTVMADLTIAVEAGLAALGDSLAQALG